MAIFALSDLHLPLGIDKPMDIFGVRWDNYVDKIEYDYSKGSGGKRKYIFNATHVTNADNATHADNATQLKIENI